MVSLLAAVLIGYALGAFLERPSLPYLLCLPASPCIYLLITFVLRSMGRGMPMPGIDVMILASIVQIPLMMLGVFLARRKGARNPYET